MVKKVEEFKEYLKQLKHLRSALNLLYWDQRTYIPDGSNSDRAEILGTISSMIFEKETSKKMKEFYDFFRDYIKDNSIDFYERAMASEMIREYERRSKIPPKLNEELTILASKGEAAWVEAKRKSDFSILEPVLTKLVDLKIELANYVGYEENPYDVLIDEYEVGTKASNIQPIFDSLKKATISLLNDIENSDQKPDISILYGDYPIQEQKKLNFKLLKILGFDFNYQRMDESAHPFTISISPHDVRITTKFVRNNFLDTILSTIHEAGHSFYEMNIDDQFIETNLYDGASMGIHESQSRIMENFIGRSFEFWTFFYPEVQKAFPKFKNISLEDFYRAVNIVRRSLIRTEADELTYNLHIIFRFELENALINKQIKVKDLPALWNEKVKEYLSIVPSNDSEGVLQDIHWSGGDFGYFPSYALGNLYSAQFYAKASEDIGDLKDHIKNGNIYVFTGWLKNNIHRWGKAYKPMELVKKVTGEALNPQYFINYVKEKFSYIYGIKS